MSTATLLLLVIFALGLILSLIKRDQTQHLLHDLTRITTSHEIRIPVWKGVHIVLRESLGIERTERVGPPVTVAGPPATPTANETTYAVFRHGPPLQLPEHGRFELGVMEVVNSTVDDPVGVASHQEENDS